MAQPPTLVEDLLLLLFQPGEGPGSGSIAGENTLYYVLGGAVLADLALGEHVRTGRGRTGAILVEAVEDRPPADDIMRSAWEYVRPRSRGVQTVLAAIGPPLRDAVLDRLAERGHIRRTSRKRLGIFTTTALTDGHTGRRDRLLADVRAALVDGVEPHPRTAALAALTSGSGALPQFDPYIPWTSATISRAKELKQGNWGAGAAAEAVTRTVTATIVTGALAATTVAPQQQ